MLVYLLRALVGFVLFQLVRELFRMLTTPVRQEGKFRPPSPSPPRKPRIHVDKENIVEGKFDDLPK